MHVGNAVGWAGAFIGLIALSDIPATAQIAAGLSVLILVSVAMLYGPTAATGFSTVVSGGTSTATKTPPNDASVPSIIQQGQTKLA
jgi:hypothetical protein